VLIVETKYKNSNKNILIEINSIINENTEIIILKFNEFEKTDEMGTNKEHTHKLVKIIFKKR
jgi:hypothetical protein